MIETKRDFWSRAKTGPQYDAIVCMTNREMTTGGKLVMGAGLARDFKEVFKGLDRCLGDRLKQDKTQELMVIESRWFFQAASHPYQHIPYIVAFPTKHKWRGDSCLELIERSAKMLARVASVFGWKKILMTRPGCRNGNLKWGDVKKRIKYTLNNRFEIISLVIRKH